MDDKTIRQLFGISQKLMQPVLDCARMLERIAALQPVGRRALAERLRLSEREVRSLADDLKASGYITVTASGMALTPLATEALAAARELVRVPRALNALEQKLETRLGIPRVIVVRGDADTDPAALEALALAACEQLMRVLRDGMTVALTGGPLMAALVRALHPAQLPGVTSLPACGGRGADPVLHADTLAAALAHTLGGTHMLMQLPYELSAEARRELLKLPRTMELMRRLRASDILVYSVDPPEAEAPEHSGSAGERESAPQTAAAAEAAGYLFAPDGSALEQTASIGLTLAETRAIPHRLALARGARSAEPVLAAMRGCPASALILDESAARGALGLLEPV